jgi:O-antigen/teichoic acid export membrane protein
VTATENPPVAGTPPTASGVGRNVTFLAASQLITWTMTLLWTLVVPRKLGPSGLGVVMAALSITGIFGMALGLGTRNYLVRLSVVDPASSAERIGTTIVLRALLSPIVFVGALIYGEVVNWDPTARHVLYLAAVATVLIQVAEPLQAAFQSSERMEFLAYSDIISKSGQGLVGIAVVLAGAGTVGVTACMAVMAGIVVLLDLYWLRGRIRIDLRTNVRRMVVLARESLPYWAFGVFFQIYLWIDFVMLSLLTRSEVVGWYAVPTRLFQTLMFLPVVVSTAWLPRFVRGFEAEDLAATARRPIELVLLLSLPICALTAVGSGPVIHLLYGHAYAHAVPVMALLGLSIPAMYMNIMLSQVLVAMNRQSQWTWVMVVTTVVNPLLNLALIPATEHAFSNGAIGAAIALFLTEMIVVGLGAALVGRVVFDGGTVRRAAVGTVVAGATYGVGMGVGAVTTPAAGLAAAIAVLPLLAWGLRMFDAEELQMIRDGFGRAAQRLPGLRRFATPSEAGAPTPP